MNAIIIKLSVLLGLLQIAVAAIPSNSYELVPPQHQEGIYSLVQKYFPADKVDTALRIIKAESNFKNIGNDSSSAFGPFQILKGTFEFYNCSGDRRVIEDNIRCAAKIYLKSGDWSDWEESKVVWNAK